MTTEGKKTRREVLADTGKAAAGVAALELVGCFPETSGRWAGVTPACEDLEPKTPLDGMSRVVEIHRESSILETIDSFGNVQYSVNEDVMRPMLEAALEAYTGGPDPWRAILPDYTDKMRIGIKVNCLNELLPTSVPLVKALVASLREGLGVSAERIIVWDRRLDELQPTPPRPRFVADELGAQVMGTIRSDSDTSGPGYSEAICGVVEGKPTRLSRIMTELTDVTINCPVLKTHTISGITGAMKNIYGIIDNPGEYHKNLVTALPALYRLPPIRKHIRLTILDALIAVTTGGTSSPPDTIPRRIMVASDPLALDKHALDLVNSLREAKGLNLPPVDVKLVEWLQKGHEIGLGSLRFQAMKL